MFLQKIVMKLFFFCSTHSFCGTIFCWVALHQPSHLAGFDFVFFSSFFTSPVIGSLVKKMISRFCYSYKAKGKEKVDRTTVYYWKTHNFIAITKKKQKQPINRVIEKDKFKRNQAKRCCHLKKIWINKNNFS